MTSFPISLPPLTILLLGVHRPPDKHGVVGHHLLDAFLDILLVGVLLQLLGLQLALVFLVIAIVVSFLAVGIYGLLQAKVGVLFQEGVLVLFAV